MNKEFRRVFLGVCVVGFGLISVLAPSGVYAESASACGNEPQGYCDEGDAGPSGTGHEFGSGAQYSCGPGDAGCHLSTYIGYCHQYHNPCEPY